MRITVQLAALALLVLALGAAPAGATDEELPVSHCDPVVTPDHVANDIQTTFICSTARHDVAQIIDYGQARHFNCVTHDLGHHRFRETCRYRRRVGRFERDGMVTFVRSLHHQPSSGDGPLR